jgi:hypothetical protein
MLRRSARLHIPGRAGMPCVHYICSDEHPSAQAYAIPPSSSLTTNTQLQTHQLLIDPLPPLQEHPQFPPRIIELLPQVSLRRERRGRGGEGHVDEDGNGGGGGRGDGSGG